jgi:hypothetical protein
LTPESASVGQFWFAAVPNLRDGGMVKRRASTGVDAGLIDGLTRTTRPSDSPVAQGLAEGIRPRHRSNDLSVAHKRPTAIMAKVTIQKQAQAARTGQSDCVA